MQTTQLIMLVTMIACAAGIIIQDIFMAINKIPGDTFSELFARGLQNSLLFQVSLGVVLGHLCIHISQSQWKAPFWMSMSVLGMLSLIALAMDLPHWFGWTTESFIFLRHYPIIVIIGCMLVGYFIWPQKMLP